MKEHHLAGKLMIVGIIALIPLIILFSYKVATTYCTGDVCIKPNEEFVYKCEGNTCVYNLDFKLNPITVSESDTLYTVKGKCIEMVSVGTFGMQECVDIKTFTKASWNKEDSQFNGFDLVVFQKKI